ncbi:hypothetical protein [Spiroplasma culicicola]|uniref:Transmembrane protein n=1 Tax=Spiroplasma culicicola AES-1 TaxID=1276246 RepID=W6A8J9_9MOLU|nr:hypothetical protein [Spiroplasma culicicola]AHI53205.1 hypothetical protein SCULI_v1c08650 [Spiroplasma culicicola AES-1]
MSNPIGRVKTMASLFNWFGLIASVFLAAFLIFAFSSPDWLNLKDQKFEFALWSSVTMFFATMSIAFQAYIIHFIKTSDDVTFINNRYILVLFSLSVGGLFTPFILMSLPNINVKSSVTPKISISRGYGISAASSAGVAMLTFASVLTDGNGWDTLAANSTANIILWSVLGTILFWGLINIILFVGKNALVRYENSNGSRAIMNFIAFFNLIFATIVLIWILIWSVLTILNAIASLFDRQRGFFSSLFNFMYVSMIITRQLFIMYTAWHCIKGIWAKQGEFEYNAYSKLSEKENSFNKA